MYLLQVKVGPKKKPHSFSGCSINVHLALAEDLTSEQFLETGLLVFFLMSSLLTRILEIVYTTSPKPKSSPRPLILSVHIYIYALFFSLPSAVPLNKHHCSPSNCSSEWKNVTFKGRENFQTAARRISAGQRGDGADRAASCFWRSHLRYAGRRRLSHAFEPGIGLLTHPVLWTTKPHPSLRREGEVPITPASVRLPRQLSTLFASHYSSWSSCPQCYEDE